MTVMIDRQGSPDRDDALHITPDGDGWTLTVHIADVPVGLPPGGTADTEARRRGHTRYGTWATLHMLPGSLVSRLTLAEHAARPTLAVTLHVDAGGAVTGHQLARAATRPTAMDHEQVAAALADPAHPQHEMLTHAERCAQALFAHRRGEGALAVYDLTRGWAVDDDGQLVRLDAPERNVGYIIVQECMIAANSAIAAWAVRNDVPILFRNHTAVAAAPAAADLAADVDAAVLADAPGQLDAARQRLSLIMRAATYDPTVRGHYALTLPAYTHATSPLRRYADLVTLRQVLAALDGGQPPHSPAQLEELAAELNTAAAERRERTAAALKERAHATARAQAAGDVFTHLPPARFTAVLKRAAKEGLHSDALDDEVRRRADAGALALADVAHVLAAVGDAWLPLRRHLISRAAVEPHTAPSLLAMHTARHDLPAVEYACEVAGQAPQEVFTAQASCGQVSGASRRAESKKAAQHRAALSLLAALAGVEDPSADAVDEPRRPSGPPPDIEGQHPVSVLNEYTQAGYVTALTWNVNRAGPAHAPVFTAWVHAEVPDRGELRASGQAGSKAGARERAAGALLELLRGEA